MAVVYGQVSCTTAATQILTPAIANTDSYVEASQVFGKYPYRQVTFINTSATTVYLGDALVTSATGIPVAQNVAFTMLVSPLDSIYGRTASSTATVGYITSG